MSEEDFNLFLANVLASVHGAGKVASLMRRPISEVYAAKLSAYYGQPVSPDFSLADVVKHVSEKLGRARTVHRQTLDGIEAIRELSKVGGSDPDPDPDPGPSRFRGALAGWGAGGAAGSVLGAGLGVAGGLAGLHYMRRAGDERLVEALADNPELSSRALAAGVGVAGGGAGALLGGTVSGATGLMAGASRPGGADPDAPWYAGHGAAGALLGGAAGGVLSAPPREGVSALGRLGAGALIGAGLGAAGAVAADRATSWLAPRDAERQKTGGEALRYDAGRGAEAGGMVGGIGGGLAGAGLGAYTGSGWKSRLARGAAGGLAGAIGGGTVGMGVGAHTGAGASVIDPQGVTPEWQRHAVGGGALGAGLGVAGGAATGALLGRGWRDALTAGLGAGLAGGVAGGLGGAVVGGQRQAMDNVGL